MNTFLPVLSHRIRTQKIAQSHCKEALIGSPYAYIRKNGSIIINQRRPVCCQMNTSGGFSQDTKNVVNVKAGSQHEAGSKSGWQGGPVDRIIQKKTMTISYNAVTVIKNTAGISD